MIDEKTRDQLRLAIGENVARLRKEKGWTQTQLAENVGSHYVQINRIENGHQSPSVELLFLLADSLGVSADTLRQIPLTVS